MSRSSRRSVSTEDNSEADDSHKSHLVCQRKTKVPSPTVAGQEIEICYKCYAMDTPVVGFDSNLKLPELSEISPQDMEYMHQTRTLEEHQRITGKLSKSKTRATKRSFEETVSSSEDEEGDSSSEDEEGSSSSEEE